ncbi:TPA: hypothetical protein ACXKGF_005222, partial [Escherichia coli]
AAVRPTPSNVVRARLFVCAAVDAHGKFVYMRSPERYVERLTTGNEPGQPPHGLTTGQSLSQTGAILLVSTSSPATNTRVSTSRPDAITRLSTSSPASGTSLAVAPRNQINQPSSDCDRSYAPPMTHPKNASI